ncbi:simple sugar transport system permease protein [Desulfobaculum xiamenense]|uniref:Simple sugar transport system permease protein n=1 Tax=Desulfobaculum xiamenense TaxID=995050 RepID=A0A846QPB7_9BACT|nr:ABC transporter permease [Desulfobaculum xiamenense]NJB68850.1 simple sugar transport system permease protein [Desulfobaculum xiamenense]
MFGLNVVKRQEPPKWGSFLIYPGCIALSLCISCLLLAAQGKPALEGMVMLWQGAFGAWYAFEDTLLKTVPIFLCSLGVAVTFRMQVWNIGAEGQFALGAVGATWAVLTFPNLPGWQLMPIMFLSSAVAGCAWGLIPAYLKLRLKVNEIITTLMLNYIGILILQFLVYGPWKAKASFGFPMTEEFPSAAVVAAIPGTRLHWGVAVCVVAAVILTIFLSRSRLGFELKASGESLGAARYARMPYGFLVMLVMGLCGALAGWAGMLETSAVVGRLQPSIMVGYGYTAIVVAWLARLKPWAIGLAAVFLAALRVGTENLMLELQVPAAFGHIMEGLILVTVIAGQFFMNYSIRLGSAEVSK